MPTAPSPAPFFSGDLTRRALARGAAAGSLLGLGLGGLQHAAPAAAQQGTPAASAPAAHRLSLGQVELDFLFDVASEGPIRRFAINAPAGELAADGLTPDSPVAVSNQALLVETGDQRVLIDAGIGPQAQGQVMAALAAEGIAPEEIDIVLISHLHSDHFGGLLDANGVLAFPNARVLLNEAEQAFWRSEPTLDALTLPEELKVQARQLAVALLEALQDSIELIAPGDEIAPGITAVDARGHTPGHLATEITSDGQRLLYVADAAIVPELHLAHPDWFMIADTWPAWSLTTRTALMDRAAAENMLVAASHFPFPGVGRVTKAEIGWDWLPAT